MSTNPHESFRQKLDSLMQTGQSIAGRLSDLKLSAGKVGLAGAIGREWLPDHRGLICAAKRLLGAQGSLQEASLRTETSNWLKEIGRAISDTSTGRRRGEITSSLKRKWLKELARQCRSKSLKVLVLGVNKTLSQIHIEVTKLESMWHPRGKMIVGGRVLEGRAEIAGILKGIDKGPVIVCDPYVSSATLVTLESVPLSTEMVLLTENTDDRSRFHDNVERLRGQGRRLTIGVIDKRGGSRPHDRFIVSPTRVWMVGASIKDIGKRDTMVIEIDNPSEVSALMSDYIEGRRGVVKFE
jgi:hypothetical protein